MIKTLIRAKFRTILSLIIAENNAYCHRCYFFVSTFPYSVTKKKFRSYFLFEIDISFYDIFFLFLHLFHLSLLLFCPVLRYAMLSHPILSHPILPYPILSYPILSYPILSYPTLSHPILSSLPPLLSITVFFLIIFY